MSNLISSALNNSIGFIQLKLCDFGLEEIDFDKIVEQRLQNNNNLVIPAKNLELLEKNRISYINPVCPHCHSHKINKQEYRERNIINGDTNPLKLYLRRYLCRSCGKKFITSLKSIIKPKSKYLTVLKDKVIEIIKTGYRSLRNTSKDVLNLLNIHISHQTVDNWLQKPENTQIDVKPDYSGYYCYDEQYVKINGIWMYRLTLYDHILNIPVNEKITSNKEYNTIKQFLKESTHKKPCIAITTDHRAEYITILDKLGVKHQLCLFHFYKVIGDKLNKQLRSKKVSKSEQTQIMSYYKVIREIFHVNNYKSSYKRLQELLKDLYNVPDVLKRIIKHVLVPNFKRLTIFLHDPKISPTNNPIENYYRQTLPRANKKIYKTPKGLNNYLQLKKQNWTQKHRKHH